MSDPVGERAVVLGGSISGLFAARILADFFPHVIVVDRDPLTDVVGPRRAVPQGHHIHGLLARGQQILEELFPGITKEMSAAGVPTRDFGTSLRYARQTIWVLGRYLAHRRGVRWALLCAPAAWRR